MIKMADLIKKQNDMILKSTGMKITENLKKEGGPGSGPHGNGDDEENPFDREPTDDEMADIDSKVNRILKGDKLSDVMKSEPEFDLDIDESKLSPAAKFALRKQKNKQGFSNIEKDDIIIGLEN